MDRRGQVWTEAQEGGGRDWRENSPDVSHTTQFPVPVASKGQMTLNREDNQGTSQSTILISKQRSSLHGFMSTVGSEQDHGQL